jgi:cytochrome oxidase Cu insertion factor (SCO1/SenC/PrrC family)
VDDANNAIRDEMYKHLILLIKLFLLCAAAVMAVVTAGVAYAAEGLFPAATVMAAPATQTKLPDFEFANLHGGTLKTSEMKGKVIIIRFWATW